MAEAILNKMPWKGSNENPERLLTREWLVTNGLGGYASGSVAGVATHVPGLIYVVVSRTRADSATGLPTVASAESRVLEPVG